VIRAEDAKFYIHHGFDFEAIQAAMKYNKTHKKQKGASTISQQTAKNVFLWPSRSWLRKGMEVYFTVLIEALWSKDRILEVYLNVIELGPGVYGVEAASKKYFHKKAKNLSNREGALMAAVLPNPIKFKISRPSAYVLRRQRKIMGGGAVVTVAQPQVKEASKDTQEFFDIKFDTEEEESGGETPKAETPPQENLP
jgi:monofunctional biosynthetic peptidoglycan transglycosylase